MNQTFFIYAVKDANKAGSCSGKLQRVEHGVFSTSTLFSPQLSFTCSGASRKYSRKVRAIIVGFLAAR